MKVAPILFILLIIPFSCLFSQENNQCEFAKEIICGETVMDTVYLDDLESHIIGHFSNFDSRAKWFKFIGTGEVFILDLNNNYQDLFLYQNACNSLQYISRDDDPIYLISELGQEYYLAVPNSNQNEYAFTLLIECGAQPENDFCYNAQNLEIIPPLNSDTINTSTKFATDDEQCYSINRGIWYGISHTLPINFRIGNSGGNRLYYELLQETCSLNCIESGTIYGNSYSPIYHLPANINRTFSVSNYYNYETDIEFFIETFSIANNNVCSGSLELINLPDTLELDFREATIDIEGGSPNLWYKYSPDKTHAVNIKASSYLIIKMYKNSCSNLSIIDQFETEGSILFEKNSEYYITMEPQSELYFKTTLSFEEIPVVVNDTCQGALNLSINDPVIIDLNGTTRDAVSCGENQEGLWYSFIGTGKVHVLSIDYTQSTANSMKIFEGTCDTMVCISNNYIYTGSASKVKTEFGKKYLVLIGKGKYGGGVIQIRMRTFDPLPNDLCIFATSIIPNQDYIQNISVATAENINCTNNEEGVWYTFVGGDYIVQLNNYGNDIHFQLLGGSCNNIQCVNSKDIRANGLYRFYAEIGIQYFVHISGGPFLHFNISLEPALGNSTCNEAEEIVCGVPITNNLALATNSTFSASCLSIEYPGFWYKYDVGAEEYLSFTLEEYLVQGIQLLVFEGSCISEILCIGNIYLNNNRKYYFHVEAQKHYKFYIYSMNQPLTTFTIDVACHPLAQNIDCASADLLGPDTTLIYNTIFASGQDWQLQDCYLYDYSLWYRFVGNGEVVLGTIDNGSLRILDGPCNELNCFNSSYNSFNFSTEIGKTYHLAIQDGYINDFILNLSSSPPPSNNDYEGAMHLNCGDIITQSYIGSTFDSIQCSHFTSTRRGVWYTFEGNDQLVQINNLTNGYSILLDEDLNCLDVSNFYPSFFAEDGEVYYLNILTDNWAQDTLMFEFNCSIVNDNSLCRFADPFICNDTLLLDFENVYENYDPCYNGSPAKWYTLMGNNDILTFKNISTNQATIRIIEGNCMESSCLIDQYLYTNDSISFFFISDKNYLVQFGDPDEINSLEIYGYCNAIFEGDICTNSLQINLDDTIISKGSYQSMIYNSSCRGLYEGTIFWYKYYSPNYSYTFLDVLSNYSIYSLAVLEGSCSSNCLSPINGNYEYDATYVTKADTWYYIGFSIYGDDEFEFKLSEVAGSYISDCLETHILNDLILPNDDHPTGIIQASQSISAQNTIIGSTGNYHWTAGDSITLNSGFEIQPSATLEINISDCSNNN